MEIDSINVIQRRPLILKCCVKTCNSIHISNNTESLVFHKIPKDKEVRQKWFDAIGIYSDKPSFTCQNKVCSLHFCDEDYATNRKIRLNKGAVPSRRLGISSQEVVQHMNNVNLTQQQLKLPLKGVYTL